ncbi:hypothetical protein [Micromonospora sp. NPDC093277]|uniref:hypothetical protein n=1 Tax=Micromonospora sp. NPDC093277 TaxID=3364291 RepID=UPI0037F91295
MRAEPKTRPPATPNREHRPPPTASAPDPIPFASAEPRTAATARRRPAEETTGPRHDPAERADAVRQPAGAAWPTTDEVGHRLTTALRDAGLLAPADGREAPSMRWPVDGFPEPADLDSRLGPATDARAGQGVHLHVHLDRVEVVHPAPPAPAPTPRRPDPPPRRPAPSVDHDAYLARRRQDRR